MGKGFPQQAAQSVLHELAAAFHGRGGRNLKKARPEVVAAARKARTKKTVHKRPRQFGNPLFFFISKKRSMGIQKTFAELNHEWKSMNPDSKDVWKHMQKNDARRSRRQVQEVKDAVSAREEAASAALTTPWDLGDKTWPIKEEILEEFMAQFRSKAKGMVALRKFGEEPQSESEKACNAYKDLVDSHKKKYHSMDAATYAAKAVTVSQVTSENLPTFKTAADILKVSAPTHHCGSRHPGFCKSKHGSAELQKIYTFMKMIPKESAVLRLETKTRSKKILYVKLTIG